MKTRLILLRHGESLANLENRFAGQTDTPLTETGILQGKYTAEFLKNERIAVAYSSDLSRAYDTARFTAAHHGLKVIKHPGLREINGGLWENLTYPEIMGLFPKTYKTWINNIGLTCCEGGESVKDVQKRFYSACDEIAQKHLGQTVLIGTHAMALRAFVVKILDIPLEKMQAELPWVTNASVTRVDYENGKFALIKYGEDAHLRSAGLKTSLHTKA